MARHAARSRSPTALKAAAPRARKPARLRLDGLSVEQQVARLLEDREALMARVAELEDQVARQQRKQTDVAERLTWALDSLREILNAAGK